MNLELVQHTPDFATTGQLHPNAIAELARAGFRTLINNRPDGEGGPDQPTSQQIAAAAQAAGLQYHYIPVISGAMTAQNVADLAALLPQLPNPVLAFCRGGSRSTALWAAAKNLAAP